MHMLVNPEIEVSSQSPAFLRSVNERMEAYRERVATKIKAEMNRRGEDPIELGHAIGVRDRTVERWLAKTSEPRLKNLKALAEHWGLELSELRPDLEEEERQLQAQLNRIEVALRGQLQLLLAMAQRLGVEGAEPLPAATEQALDEVALWLEQAASEREAARRAARR